MTQRRGRGAWSGAASELVHALREGQPLRGEGLRALLTAVGEQPPAATWHPTGFVVLELHAEEHGALRLHLWPPHEREHGRPCWPIHDHVWHLRSHVLCGVVESHGYEVVDDPAGAAVLYAVEYGAGRRSCMRRSGRRVRVQAGAPRSIEAGSGYAVAAGQFHASQVAAQTLAATLVITQRTAQPWPWVVGDANGPDVVPVERPLAQAGVVVELLRQVTAAVG